MMCITTMKQPQLSIPGRRCGPCHPPRALAPSAARARRTRIVTKTSEEDCAVVLEKLAAAGRRLVDAAAATAAAALVLLSPGPAAADEVATLVRLPASPNPDVFEVQKTLVEAWQIIGESFVDPAFNHHNWQEELLDHMAAVYKSDSGGSAYGEIQAMLSDLGDPYTRVVPPEWVEAAPPPPPAPALALGGGAEYEDFRVSTDGEMQGVGLMIANEPVHNHLLVLAPIKGGPADRAGLLPGDELLSIDGTATDGWTGQQAAKLLRGKGGTEVRVRFVRPTDGIPGTPGRPEPPLEVPPREVRMRRERVELSPLYFTALTPPAAPARAAAAAPAVHPRARGAAAPPVAGAPLVGYLRLSSFTSNAAALMEQAIATLKSQGAGSFILDLRNNPGGLVTAGMDVARLWLDGAPVVFNVSGRPGEMQQQVQLQPGGAVSKDPLVVLVNENSASASEIVSGALHDNGRATIIGDSPTFGKGRIQSVFELQDGSALFVTVAKYRTPTGTEIDHQGIRPDRSCSPPLRRTPLRSNLVSAAASVPAPSPEGAGQQAGPGGYLPGLPAEALASSALAEQLQGDSCVLTARQLLEQQRARVAPTPAARVALRAPPLAGR